MAYTPPWLELIEQIIDSWDNMSRSDLSNSKDRGVITSVLNTLKNNQSLSGRQKDSLILSIQMRLGKTVAHEGPVMLTKEQRRGARNKDTFSRLGRKISTTLDQEEGVVVEPKGVVEGVVEGVVVEHTTPVVPMPMLEHMSNTPEPHLKHTTNTPEKHLNHTSTTPQPHFWSDSDPVFNGLDPLTERNETKLNGTYGCGSSSLATNKKLSSPPPVAEEDLSAIRREMIPSGLVARVKARDLGNHTLTEEERLLLAAQEANVAVTSLMPMPTPKSMDTVDIIHAAQTGEADPEHVIETLSQMRSVITQLPEYKEHQDTYSYSGIIPRGFPHAAPSIEVDLWIKPNRVVGKIILPVGDYNLRFSHWDEFESRMQQRDHEDISNRAWREHLYELIGQAAAMESRSKPDHHKTEQDKFAFSGMHDSNDWHRDSSFQKQRVAAFLQWNDGQAYQVFLWNGTDYHVIPLKHNRSKKTGAPQMKGKV